MWPDGGSAKYSSAPRRRMPCGHVVSLYPAINARPVRKAALTNVWRLRLAILDFGCQEFISSRGIVSAHFTFRNKTNHRVLVTIRKVLILSKWRVFCLLGTIAIAKVNNFGAE